MGNGQSVSEDDRTGPQKFIDGDNEDGYGATVLEDEKYIAEEIVRLPLHHGNRSIISDFHPSKQDVVDDDKDHSSDTRHSSSTQSTEDHSLMPSDSTDEENEERSTISDAKGATYESGSPPTHAGPLFDADDVTAMTDMAHDGDDEATASETELPKQRGPVTLEERRARWARRASKEDSESTSPENTDDEEETIMIIDAEEEYSRSSASFSKVSGVDRVEKQMQGATALTGSKEQQNSSDDETSDKENGSSLHIDGIAGESVEANRAPDTATLSPSLKAPRKTAPDPDADFSIASYSTKRSKVHVLVPVEDADDSAPAEVVSKLRQSSLSVNTAIPLNYDYDQSVARFSTEDAKMFIVIPATDVDDNISLVTANTRSTRGSRVHVVVPVASPAERLTTERQANTQAPVQTVVSAKEVIRGGDTSMKIVMASDVDTLSKRELCYTQPSWQACESDRFQTGTAVQRETPSPRHQREMTETVSMKMKMTVVVASDVEASSQQDIGCIPGEGVFQCSDHELPHRNKVSDITTKRTSRDVPVIVNGKVVGSSATWTAPKATPYAIQESGCRRPDHVPAKPKPNNFTRKGNSRNEVGDKPSPDALERCDGNADCAVAVPKPMNAHSPNKNDAASRLSEVEVKDVVANSREAIPELTSQQADEPRRKSGAEPDGTNTRAIAAKIRMPPSPNKKHSRGLAVKAQIAKSLSNAMSPSPEEIVVRAIDALGLKTATLANSCDADPKQPQRVKKTKVRSPKPEDGRIGGRQKSPIAIAPAEKITGNDKRDISRIASADFDGIDLTMVEQFEETFNMLLKKHPQLVAKNPKMVETLRVAKLQKLLSVTLDVENEMEDYVESLAEQKDEMAFHYHNELLEAAKKKASQEILIHEARATARRDLRTLEGFLTWQMMSMYEIHAKQCAQLREQLLRQSSSIGADVADLLALLPPPLADNCRALRESAGAAQPLSEPRLRQLQVSTTLLRLQSAVLEKKLFYLQAAATKHAWVDSVLRRLDAEQRLALKRRFEEKHGITF